MPSRVVVTPFLGRPLFFAGPAELAVVSLLGRPRFRGRLVPGGADKFTVQYEPKPGSVTGRG